MILTGIKKPSVLIFGSWYGVSERSNNLIIANKVLTVTDNGLYLAEQNLGDCSLLLGVIHLSDQVVIACPQHILLLSKAGELIDQIDQNIGLQQIFTATTSENGIVFLQDNKAVYRLNTNDLSFAIAANYPNNWLKPVLPSRINGALVVRRAFWPLIWTLGRVDC